MDLGPLLERKAVHVLVKPKSRKTQMLAYDAARDLLTIALAAPPEDGKANRELERYLSQLTSKEWHVKTGKTSKRKLLLSS